MTSSNFENPAETNEEDRSFSLEVQHSRAVRVLRVHILEHQLHALVGVLEQEKVAGGWAARFRLVKNVGARDRVRRE